MIDRPGIYIVKFPDADHNHDMYPLRYPPLPPSVHGLPPYLPPTSTAPSSTALALTFPSAHSTMLANMSNSHATLPHRPPPALPSSTPAPLALHTRPPKRPLILPPPSTPRLSLPSPSPSLL